MIAKDKLKFDKTDLKFFKNNIDNSISNMTDDEEKLFVLILETLFKANQLYFNDLTKRREISASFLATKYHTNTATIRKIIAKDRRNISNNDGMFIVANKKGYFIADIHSNFDREEIEKYFHKTQQRWKNTFNEIYNLMILLNIKEQ